MSFKVIAGSTTHDVKTFVFNDASVQVEIQGEFDSMEEEVTIQAHMTDVSDQMGLVMLTDAVRSTWPYAKVTCVMPFTPYGRQDAAFCPGQANAMKAWAAVVNSLNFEVLITFDPHSIAVSHFDRCVVIDIVEVLQHCGYPDAYITDNCMTLVSPDAGANKKAHKIAKEFGFTKMVRADKARDLATGDIIETEVYGDVEGDTCIIFDDICDGGMTFIKLAEALRAKGAKKVILFVTHGIFSKGLAVFDGLIDEIHTTKCWKRTPHENDDGYSGLFIVRE